MVKYKQHVADMLEVHKDLFLAFKKIHDEYEKDPKKWQKEFNEKGLELIPVMQRWENSLCSKSEAGKFGKFSSTLADKFRSEIKVHFPKIDHIGMDI